MAPPARQGAARRPGLEPEAVMSAESPSVSAMQPGVTGLTWLEMDDAMLSRGLAIRDWLLTEGRNASDLKLIVAGLCEQLASADIPVDRAMLVLQTLHAEQAAMAMEWKRAEGLEAEAIAYSDFSDKVYEESPFAAAHRARADINFRIDETPDDRFGIVADLRAQGYTHYFCAPLLFANGHKNGVSFATRTPGGFSDAELTLLRALAPTIEAVLEIYAGYEALHQLLRTYIGDEPHRLVLDGDVRRGHVTRIRSAILFADMRDYTQRSSSLTPEQTVDLLNAYFDCIVPPIEAEGGEVLKYLGDGLLAIFRDRGDDAGSAAQAALDAASAALARLEAWNASHPDQAIATGIALHHGEAAYGNVGSGARLDFTIIGRDVNVASRLAGLNKALGEPLIMSGALTEQLWGMYELVGTFALKGIPDEIKVYRP